MSNPVCQTTLAFHSHTQITARFDGGNLTSDAGWLLFGSLDRQDRLCEDFSSCIADSRDQRYVRHEQLKLIRQCHRFLANQFRLLLHGLAYQMFVRLRDYLYGTPWQKLEIETLRRRVLKIGARVRQTTRRIWAHLSSGFPEQALFLLVLNRLNSS